MDNKELLTKKFLLVSMDDAEISSIDKPIIGTDSLATCIGIVLYCEERKLAIVAHVSSTPEIAISRIFQLLDDNGLNNEKFKYMIIPGYDEEHYNVIELLMQMFRDYDYFDVEEIREKIFEKDPDTPSYRFAFDTRSGKFVTDKVLYGKDYLRINNVNWKKK